MRQNQLEILFPFRPVPKARPRVSERGAYTPSRTKEHEKQLAVIMRSALAASGRKTLEKGVCVEVFFNFKAGRNSQALYPMGDIDNYLKAVLDAGNGILWLDDQQVVRVVMSKQITQADHYTNLIVHSIDNEWPT